MYKTFDPFKGKENKKHEKQSRIGSLFENNQMMDKCDIFQMQPITEDLIEEFGSFKNELTMSKDN